MRKRWWFVALFFCGAFLYAGDIATYTNLGFSEDSRYFMFGQYGIEEAKNQPYAEVFVVDLKANDFVPKGTKKVVYPVAVLPGQDGSGALYMVLRESKALVDSYKINHIKTGRVVYLLINGHEPKSTLEFRDFQGGSSYVVNLIQNTFGKDAEIESSFHINLSVTDAKGTTKAYTIGLPDFKRKGVRTYRIKQVVFSPDEKNLVFMVEREETAGKSINIRYMVETVNLQ
jgi:predicted secreted protein